MSEAGEKKAPAARKIFPPAVNEETAKFWKAAEAGKLLYGFCLACNEPHYFPRSFCPFCFCLSGPIKSPSAITCSEPYYFQRFDSSFSVYNMSLWNISDTTITLVRIFTKKS